MLATISVALVLTQGSGWTFTSASSFDEQSTLKATGVSQSTFVRLRDDVSSWVYWDKSLDEVDASAADWQSRLHGISGRLRLISDTYCQRAQIPPSSKLLRQWLFSEVVCSYVCSRLLYDFDAGNKPIPVRNREAESDMVLSQPRSTRKTMCVGFVLLARDLIRDGGKGLDIEATFVGSFGRALGETATDVANHAFLGLRLDGGITVGAELVTPRLTLKELKARSTAPRFDYVMPFTRAERELFLARNYGADETIEGKTNHGDPQNCFHLLEMSLNQWKTARTAELSELDKSETRAFDGRAKWVQVDGN